MSRFRNMVGDVKLSHRRLSRRSWAVPLLVAVTLLLTGCDFTRGGPVVVTKVIVVSPAPTITLDPGIFTTTPRFTATLIPTVTPQPTDTLPPTITPTPFTPTPAPTATPFPQIAGTVRSTANFRVGPGRDFDAQGRLTSGTRLTILSANDSREWYLVRLEDGRRGWIQANLVNTDDPEGVPILPQLELTKVALATLPPAAPTPVPTLRPRPVTANDVLAYCDLPAFSAKFGGKTIRAANAVTIYWTWEAKTPEQIQDQIDYGQYEVKLNGKLLEDWRNYRTGVSPLRGMFEVSWFVPVGKLEPGEYTIDYKLTWTQRIEDGLKSFGPGGDEESNVGSCKFTVS